MSKRAGLSVALSRKILESVKYAVETVNELCHYSKLDEEATYCLTVSEAVCENIDFSDEDQARGAVRLALAIGYSAGKSADLSALVYSNGESVH